MKTLGPAVAVFLASSVIGFAQGQILFSNTTLSLGRTELVTTNGTAGLTGTNFAAQLFFAVDFENPAATPAIVEGPSFFLDATTSVPGTWSGGVRTFVGSVNQGDTVSLIVRVWNTAVGTYNQNRAVGMGYGQSEAFSYVVPENPVNPVSLVMNNFQGFLVWTSPIPEPTTITLSLMGICVLFFKLRK